MHLLAEQLVFGGDDRGFLTVEVKTYVTAPMCWDTPKCPNSFFLFCTYCHIVYERYTVILMERLKKKRGIQPWTEKWNNLLKTQNFRLEKRTWSCGIHQ